MAVPLVGVLADGILRKVLSIAAEEISLAWGFREDLKKLAEKLEMIQALLYDADSKRMSNRAVQLWLKKLQAVASDADDMLDEFAYEVLRQKIAMPRRKRDKVRCFFSSSNPLASRLYMAHKIKNVRESLEEVYKESNEIGLRVVELLNSATEVKEIRLTDPFLDDSDVVGRTDDRSKVAEMLITFEDVKNLSVVGIVGLPGQGKTTLAKLVYKNDRVVNHFDRRIWICVSDDFVVEKLLSEMVQSLNQVKCEMTNREALVKKLQGSLNAKRYLIVLDDVWNEDRDKWETMRNCLLEIGGSKGSKIMVTTRSNGVILTMQTSLVHQLEVLSPDESWTLFKKIAFADGGATEKPRLVAIGRRILERCGGVPLAIKALGGLMYSQKDESGWLEIQNSEIWSSSNKLDGVLTTLRLSYDHLPSLPLKQCFSYCSIFQKDTIIEKDILIQLWMAQGFLNPSTNSRLEMETIGSNCFNILLWTSLLQDAKKDGYNNIVSCKMHDLVHDLALHTSKDYCSTLESKEVNDDIRASHLSLIVGEHKLLRFPNDICLKLRTLYLVGSIPGEILTSLVHLRVLILDDFGTEELPRSLGKLKHLRYLDVSRTSIKRLPNSITKLYYLQTLRLKELEEMPKNFENLVNLRHFYIEDTEQNRFRCNFAGIGQLIHLQTLPFFFIDQDKCQIAELGGLKNLKGDLKIYGLENLRSSKEAITLNLSSKSKIERLELHWDPRESTSPVSNDEKVLDALRPHSNLKGLLIENFEGSDFPLWMVLQGLSSIDLNNLMTLSLTNCSWCEQIPPLGHLPHLKAVEIYWLPSVQSIDSEFYGITSLTNIDEIAVFPSLIELSLTNLSNLIEWLEPEDLLVSTIKVFPNLQKLNVGICPLLTSLPSMNGLTNLKTLNITMCKELICLPEEIGSLVSLQNLQIWKCPNLVSIPDFHGLQSLWQLYITDCEKLIALPNGLEMCTSLNILDIHSCPALQLESLHCLTSLNLRYLIIGGFSDALDYFPWPPSSTSYDAPSIENVDVKNRFGSSLNMLWLYGWPRLNSLPEQLQHLSGLKSLRIQKFSGLESLPEWLGKLTSLEELLLSCCQNLLSLPSAESMQEMSNLQKLEIRDCPFLGARCNDSSHPEFDKIAHIPQVEIKQ